MILLCILATYSVSLMFTEADGPYGVFARLRNAFIVFNCFLCTSVWVGGAVALYLADNPVHWLITALGLSGGALLIHYVTLMKGYDGK